MHWAEWSRKTHTEKGTAPGLGLGLALHRKVKVGELTVARRLRHLLQELPCGHLRSLAWDPKLPPPLPKPFITATNKELRLGRK